jgi:uncharacterized protein with FMN-binding domain
MNTQNKVFIVIGTVAILAAAGIGGAVLFATPDTMFPSTSSLTSSSATASIAQSSASSTGSSQSSAASTASNSLVTSYKDGTYTASISYYVPHGGTNSLSTTIVVSGGVITSVKTSNNYTDRESGMYIDDFNSSVASSAEGKQLANYSPSRIGGASLTTSAFDDVLDTIRSQAT